MKDGSSASASSKLPTVDLSAADIWGAELSEHFENCDITTLRSDNYIEA